MSDPVRMNYSKPQSLDTQEGADDLGAMGFIVKQIDELNNQLSRIDGAKIAAAFPGKFTVEPTDDDRITVWYEPPYSRRISRDGHNVGDRRGNGNDDRSPRTCRVGHRYVSARMARSAARIPGEGCGSPGAGTATAMA